MTCWFLSYNSQDLALMQALDAALRRKDPKAQIFFAPTSLRAGGFWLPELAKGLAEATAFVLLVGEKGLGWTEDCVHANYDGAPVDGAAWCEADGGDCRYGVARGGAFT